jgi:hypothetical protein
VPPPEPRGRVLREANLQDLPDPKCDLLAAIVLSNSYRVVHLGPGILPSTASMRFLLKYKTTAVRPSTWNCDQLLLALEGLVYISLLRFVGMIGN